MKRMMNIMKIMMNRNRLNKLEDIGFFVVVVFVSLIFGFGIVALIGKAVMLFNN